MPPHPLGTLNSVSPSKPTCLPQPPTVTPHPQSPSQETSPSVIRCSSPMKQFMVSPECAVYCSMCFSFCLKLPLLSHTSHHLANSYSSLRSQFEYHLFLESLPAHAHPRPDCGAHPSCAFLGLRSRGQGGRGQAQCRACGWEFVNVTESGNEGGTEARL